MTTDQVIGERIHHEMWRRKVTQTSIATELGITQTAVSRKLRGQRPWYPDELLTVAGTLDVSMNYLFGITEGQEGPAPQPAANSGWTLPSVLISLDAARHRRFNDALQLTRDAA